MKPQRVWLSFCDSERPEGSQFLGAAIVEGEDVVVAAKSAWALGCNPGGEVLGIPIPAEMDERIGSEWRNRLLTLEECKAFDRAMASAEAASAPRRSKP